MKTDTKLDDYDKHVQTDCKNNHSTSKVLGHVTTHSINLILTSGVKHPYIVTIRSQRNSWIRVSSLSMPRKLHVADCSSKLKCGKLLSVRATAHGTDNFTEHYITRSLSARKLVLPLWYQRSQTTFSHSAQSVTLTTPAMTTRPLKLKVPEMVLVRSLDEGDSLRLTATICSALCS